jgi:hypothetical protein
MGNRPPKQMIIPMQREDVARNMVDIINTMDAIRGTALRNFYASDDVKLEYLRMTSELASCMQDTIKDNGIEVYVKKVNEFIDNDLLLYFDFLQRVFWDEVEPGFSKALSDLTVVVLRDNFVSEGQVYHIFQGLKYLIAPPEKKDGIYISIQPFNNLLSEELISKPVVAGYFMRNLFLDFVEQSPEGYGMVLQNTRLDTPEFIERLGRIGALFIDIPYALFGEMRRSFPNVTIVGDGQDRKARILFRPEQNGPVKNLFEFFSEYAAEDMGEAQACLTGGVKNVYAFGKAFLEAMQKVMGLLEGSRRPGNSSRMTGPTRIGKDGDVFVVSNVILYDLDECQHTVYPQIRLDIFSDDEVGNVEGKTQGNWIRHYAGSNKMMLNLPLMYAILESIYNNMDKDIAKELLQGLQSDFEIDYLTMSTRFNYEKDKVKHNVTMPEEIEFHVHIPGYEGYIQNIVNSPEWENPLRSIFMTQDLEKIPKVLGMFKNRRAYLRTPNSDRNIERAAFVGLDNGIFNISGNYSLDSRGRFRGIYCESLF